MQARQAFIQWSENGEEELMLLKTPSPEGMKVGDFQAVSGRQVIRALGKVWGFPGAAVGSQGFCSLPGSRHYCREIRAGWGWFTIVYLWKHSSLKDKCKASLPNTRYIWNEHRDESEHVVQLLGVWRQKENKSRQGMWWQKTNKKTKKQPTDLWPGLHRTGDTISRCYQLYFSRHKKWCWESKHALITLHLSTTLSLPCISGRRQDGLSPRRLAKSWVSPISAMLLSTIQSR